MMTNMYSKYNKQNTNTKICNAYDCYEVATTIAYVSVKDKKISLGICENCIVKFMDEEIKHNENIYINR